MIEDMEEKSVAHRVDKLASKVVNTELFGEFDLFGNPSTDFTGIATTPNDAIGSRPASTEAIATEAIICNLGAGKLESSPGTLRPAFRIGHRCIGPHEAKEISPGRALRIALVLRTGNGTVRNGRRKQAS